MAAVVTTGLTQTMSTYFSKVFLEKSRLLIRHDAFAQKRGVPANQGKIVNFTRHIQQAVAVTGLTESVTPAGVATTAQTIAVTLVEYGNYEQISKFYERTSIDVGLKEQVEAVGINMGESILWLRLAKLVLYKTSLNILEPLRKCGIMVLQPLKTFLWKPEVSYQLQTI